VFSQAEITSHYPYVKLSAIKTTLILSIAPVVRTPVIHDLHSDIWATVPRCHAATP